MTDTLGLSEKELKYVSCPKRSANWKWASVGRKRISSWDPFFENSSSPKAAEVSVCVCVCVCVCERERETEREFSRNTQAHLSFYYHAIYKVIIINLSSIWFRRNLIDFPGGSDGKASAYNVGDLGSIPGSGRFPGEGNGNPLQYSRLENPMDRGAS